MHHFLFVDTPSEECDTGIKYYSTWNALSALSRHKTGPFDKWYEWRSVKQTFPVQFWPDL